MFKPTIFRSQGIHRWCCTSPRQCQGKGVFGCFVGWRFFGEKYDFWGRSFGDFFLGGWGWKSVLSLKDWIGWCFVCLIYFFLKMWWYVWRRLVYLLIFFSGCVVWCVWWIFWFLQSSSQKMCIDSYVNHIIIYLIPIVAHISRDSFCVCGFPTPNRDATGTAVRGHGWLKKHRFIFDGAKNVKMLVWVDVFPFPWGLVMGEGG